MACGQSGDGLVEVRKALRLWARALLAAMAEPGAGIPAIDDKQGESEMTTLLETSARKIRADIFEQGVARGLEQGIAQGIERGLESGRSEERERLRRELSALELDPQTAARVSRLLDCGKGH